MKIKSLLFILLISLTSVSQSAYQPYFSAPNLQQQSPSKVLNHGIQRLRAFITNQTPTQSQLKAFIENEMVGYFDFDYMVKWAAGRYYKTLDSYQRDQVSGIIKEMFFKTLVKALVGKSFPDVRFLRERAGHYSNELNVIALIKQQGQIQPLKINFRLYKSNDGWKVFDVSAGGRSAIQYYRTYLKKMFTKMQSENLL